MNRFKSLAKKIKLAASIMINDSKSRVTIDPDDLHLISTIIRLEMSSYPVPDLERIKDDLVSLQSCVIKTIKDYKNIENMEGRNV